MHKGITNDHYFMTLTESYRKQLDITYESVTSTIESILSSATTETLNQFIETQENTVYQHIGSIEQMRLTGIRQETDGSIVLEFEDFGMGAANYTCSIKDMLNEDKFQLMEEIERHILDAHN